MELQSPTLCSSQVGNPSLGAYRPDEQKRNNLPLKTKVWELSTQFFWDEHPCFLGVGHPVVWGGGRDGPKPIRSLMPSCRFREVVGPGIDRPKGGILGAIENPRFKPGSNKKKQGKPKHEEPT